MQVYRQFVPLIVSPYGVDIRLNTGKKDPLPQPVSRAARGSF